MARNKTRLEKLESKQETDPGRIYVWDSRDGTPKPETSENDVLVIIKYFEEEKGETTL